MVFVQGSKTENVKKIYRIKGHLGKGNKFSTYEM